MKEDKYEIDGFVFNSKAEYYKYLIVSLLLVIAYIAFLVFAFTYPIEANDEYQIEHCCRHLCKKNTTPHWLDIHTFRCE